ncbi:hypothetical protein TSOC_003616 [Tetrabaena socialis]|uniref:Uncharacterized protein n=1 Tax=Tetrabaena socialis TaxID=47790 RepID=A0A2J8AB18_9CHLO|nr:hypothetical protein TSOC_003616 [Tetrabaena socialis]|eukprot:PNH09715.1 hypothetical protein TSOC_003616 [Tetrabaena socialis]
MLGQHSFRVPISDRAAVTAVKARVRSPPEDRAALRSAMRSAAAMRRAQSGGKRSQSGKRRQPVAGGLTEQPAAVAGSRTIREKIEEERKFSWAAAATTAAASGAQHPFGKQQPRAPAEAPDRPSAVAGTPPEDALAPPEGLRGASFCGLMRWHHAELHVLREVFKAAFPAHDSTAGTADGRRIALYASDTAAPDEPLRRFDGVRLYTNKQGRWRMSCVTDLIKSLTLPPDTTHLALWRLPDGRLVVSPRTEDERVRAGRTAKGMERANPSLSGVLPDGWRVARGKVYDANGIVDASVEASCRARNAHFTPAAERAEQDAWLVEWVKVHGTRAWEAAVPEFQERFPTAKLRSKPNQTLANKYGRAKQRGGEGTQLAAEAAPPAPMAGVPGLGVQLRAQSEQQLEAASGARTTGSSPPLATSDADLPARMEVVCKGVSGTLLPARMVVVCGCPSCAQLDQGDPARTFLPTPWEQHCGAGAYRQWNRSIRAVLPDGGSMALHKFFLQTYGVTFTKATPECPPGKIFGPAGDT